MYCKFQGDPRERRLGQDTSARWPSGVHSLTGSFKTIPRRAPLQSTPGGREASRHPQCVSLGGQVELKNRKEELVIQKKWKTPAFYA